MSILDKVARALAKQRTVSLYVDQEDEVAKLEKQGINLTYGELVRAGVDLALAQIKEELKNK